MDLPSCPACNQSVLDDDATHCPFCGVSMSGDGSSVPVAAPPTPAAAEAAPAEEIEPETTGQEVTDSPAPTAQAQTPDTAETDPFAVDPTLAHRAIPAAAKPTKKRPWRVHCPMCDTPGYLPRQAAGRDVKCANPECLVPIFTAAAADSNQEAPEETAPEDQPAAAGGKGPLVAVLLILVAGTAGGAWWFFGNPTDPASESTAATAATAPQFGAVDPSPTDANDPKTKPSKSNDPTTAAATNISEAISTADIRDQAPPLMIAAAQQRDGNRSKPFCRQLTAEYFASLGETQAAEAQLQQLTQIGADLPHLHINALVHLWWHRQQDGSAAAGPKLVEAVQRSASLDSSNPFAVDVAVNLGCALIATGQQPLAQSTIARLWKPTLTARLRLDQLQCRQSRTFHLANRNTSPPALRGQASVDSLIIERLCTRGHSAAALTWARQGTSLFDRADRLAAWAAATRNHPQAATAKTLDNALADQDPAIRAVVFARLALATADANNKQAAATQSVSRARQALKQTAQPRTVVLGNLKQTYQLPIDDVSGWWLNAQAQADLTGALCLLGKTDDATAVLLEALASARSLGPARADVAARLKAIQAAGTSGMIQQFKTVLELTGNDEARQAAQQYSSKCQTWLVLAEQRAACLDRIHRFAIAHQLGNESWKDIRDHGLTNDATLRDPFTASTLPSFLYLSFQATGDTTATTDMNRVLPTGLPVDATETLRQRAVSLLTNGNLDAIVEAVNADSNARRDRDSRFQRRRVLFELVGIAAASKSPAQALRLVGSFRDPRLAIWREDAYRLAAAQLATRGQHALAWKYATHADRVPTEQVALLAGLLEGIEQQNP